MKNIDLDASTKALPIPSHEILPAAEVAHKTWRIPDGDLDFPVLVLKENVLSANIHLMAAYCEQHGILLAPHGKTTMSPQLFERQLSAGAWGITAATVAQCRALRKFGINRILLANVLVDASAVRWVAQEMVQDPRFEFMCYVDSIQGVERMEQALHGPQTEVQLPVLVEIGSRGGRTGCRSHDDALDLAARVVQSPVLELSGVAGFEGLFSASDMQETLKQVDFFLKEMRRLALQLRARGHIPPERRVVVTAGGSAYFDRVVENLGPTVFPFPVTTIIRSGCYITHDAEMYECTSPLAARAPGSGVRLRPALELWATVWSRPEPDLAIVGFGKRDAPYDYLLPRPERVWDADGTAVREVTGVFAIHSLNDQHAMMRIPPGDELSVGDHVSLGVNHPCTAFDKWRYIPLVDDDYVVTGGITTFF